MKIAELVNVSHTYAGHRAIQNISVGFEAEKITAIIGKSGSGKSTLLQFLNGLIKPDSGTVSVFQQPLRYDAIQSLRLRIGYMVQGTGLFPHLNVRDNISIARKIKPAHVVPPNRVEELMSLVGLPHAYANKFPHELSGGEQQRVGLCRSLFMDPALILMDEPLGALDPITRLEIQEEIISLQRLRPRTILLVTHDMREARKLADYMLILDKGEVQRYDTTENVLQNPGSPIVEQLMEASLL